MKLHRLFTSTKGRIGRADFWKGTFVLVVVVVLLSSLAILLGFSTEQTFTETTAVEGEEIREFVGTQWTVQPWASLVIGLIVSIPFAILALKRRHDRNSSGVDIYAFVGLQFVMALGAAFGLYGGIIGAVSVVQSVWSIVLLVLLGFLKGTVGSNDFGPDPLVTSTNDPSLAKEA